MNSEGKYPMLKIFAQPTKNLKRLGKIQKDL